MLGVSESWVACFYTPTRSRKLKPPKRHPSIIDSSTRASLRFSTLVDPSPYGIIETGCELALEHPRDISTYSNEVLDRRL